MVYGRCTSFWAATTLFVKVEVLDWSVEIPRGSSQKKARMSYYARKR
jgi:hypothetical protein